MKKRFIPNPLGRVRRAFLHHTGRLRRRSLPVEPKSGWTVRYRDEKGRYRRFDSRLNLRPEYYLWKQTVEDTDLPRARRPKEAGGAWRPARAYVLGRAREMAKQFMKDKESELPFSKYHVAEKGPIAYDWIHTEFQYMNDYQRFDEGNYCVFYILIAVVGEEDVTFMTIRKTVMFTESWTVERAVAEKETFDDLGRDYVQRQGHLWSSEAMSPQISTVEYVGFLGFTLFPFVPRERGARPRRRPRPHEYKREGKFEGYREAARELERKGLHRAAREVREAARRRAREMAAERRRRAAARRRKGRK